MKATIDFDDALYRRLKVEAARRGRTLRDLVAEGVRRVLDAPDRSAARGRSLEEWRPAWFGALGRYGRGVTDHSMEGVRTSIARARSRDKKA